MSNKIMKRCWPIQVPPTAKSVLIALADHASDDGKCWPSLETLANCTSASRRSVVDAVKQLEQCCTITADRSNGRHTVYSVHPERFVSVPGLVSARTAARRNTSANAARVEPGEPVQMPHQSVTPTSADAAPVLVQMPHGSEIETSANAAPTSADAALPPVQMPHQPVQMPHSNHQEPSIEPSMNPQKGGGNSFQLRDDQHSDAKPGKEPKKPAKPKFDAAGMNLPDWLDREPWCMWCRDREARKKSLTADAAKLSIRSLDALRAKGFTPQEVIENAVAMSWQGLYEPPRRSGATTHAARRPTSHNGLDTKDYSEGIENGYLT
ncbi:MAG: helix-turn-helix domain-containing protein [Hydrogenophaga sp.]|uniref:helix-turn-helix domain-containing protein n=1 Tax=Hydrogenophaga sp. TaxID=1904254 RepID=UPI00263802E9|nr:helix-turn-helix domain-containing protein [Hydrogenophaga sp.]MCW5668156.1 helix-turn-helix domain-containing protein [Hydrogenophaga sp.]